MNHINVEKVRKEFIYIKELGELRRSKTDKLSGTTHKCGRGNKERNYDKIYIRSFFDGKVLYNHRLIWVWMTGEQPDQIDHIDGNGLNNKWDNLRSVPQSVNSKNLKMYATNTSGKTGVCFRKDSSRWRARIMVDNKSISLGTFATKDEALAVRADAEVKYNFTGD